MTKSPRLLGWLVYGSAVLLVIGCGKSEPQPNNTPPSSGNAVFDQHCAQCHIVKGQIGQKNGPSLAAVGADPVHTPDWLAAHIANPRQHNPASKMPAFEGKLSAEEIRGLAEFLAAMK